MTTPLKEPHLLLASSNPRKLVHNVQHIVSSAAVRSIEREIDRNVSGLFELGLGHFNFAQKSPRRQWRQRISRLYYGAYNVKRAVQLYVDGTYRTDSTDHKKIGELPKGFPRASVYANRLVGLRDDRNIADYNHAASLDDLLMSPDDAENLVHQFVEDARDFLKSKGLRL